MKLPAGSLAFLLLAANASAADAPTELTGWRTIQGVFLSWSRTPTSVFTIWKGTAPGVLQPVATLPPGQVGFWDTSAVRALAYWYAVGDAKSHGPELILPGSTAPVRLLAGLVTTCSGLTPGGTFPANTQNFFTASRDRHVQFFGYFLMRPFDPTVREARIVWRDPKGEVFSEYSHTITPKKVELPEGATGQILLAQAIGLQESVPQNGQLRVPTEPGVYTIEVFVDDVPASLTIFYMRQEASKPAAPQPGGAEAPAGGLRKANLPGAGFP